MKKTKPVVLAILDGWGEWDVEMGNAIAQAKLPTIDKLNKYYPKTLLQASGLAVGLPWGVRGNSEVGHQAIGAGQIIFQHLPTISMSIQNSSFAKNPALIGAMEQVKKNESSLHLWGLLSDGGVHSHIDHLSALIGLAKTKGIKNLYTHAVTDGRDAPPKSAAKYIKTIENLLKNFKIGKIATLCGRYYAMDRNNNWDRIEKAYSAMVNGTGEKYVDAEQSVEDQYAKKLNDEYFEPAIIIDRKSQEPIGQIKEKDSVICFNFREDRSRQMAHAFCDEKFNFFKKTERPGKIDFTGFVSYEDNLKMGVAFPEQKITTRLGEVLSKFGKKQLRIAETEKYAHVTYFFNGGEEKPFKGEDRILIPSKNAPSYAKVPEMSAKEITDKVIEELEKDKYDFILINYANPDMVGHTGDLEAGVKSVEFVDQCLNRLINAINQKSGSLLITADHGNVEEMINTTTFEKDTEHSTNPVPCWLVSPESIRLEPEENFSPEISGMIIDIAPTILSLLGIKQPKEMIGRSLLSCFNCKA
jgi:2,3-bisphosphoglycerate-independent phosphoglycerate mutase